MNVYGGWPSRLRPPYKPCAAQRSVRCRDTAEGFRGLIAQINMARCRRMRDLAVDLLRSLHRVIERLRTLRRVLKARLLCHIGRFALINF